MPEFFAALSGEARADLRSALRPQQFERGALLFHTEDRAETLYFLHAGHVRLYRLGSAAREVTVGVLDPGYILGEMALLGGDYGLYAEALDGVQASAIGVETWKQLLKKHPTLNFAFSRQIVRQAQGQQTRLIHLVFMEVSQRLALVLLRLANQKCDIVAGKRRLSGRVSHQDLAHLAGSTRETITKLLGEFKEQGIIELGYRRIVLVDEEKLQEMTVTPLPL